jgi:hypothetical protein
MPDGQGERMVCMKCKTKNCLLLVGLLSVYLPVSACLAPPNIEGVAFTNDEQLNLESLSVLGDSGVHYKVMLNENGGKTVCYPSHYNADGTVFIGNVGLLYESEMTINCMGIVVPQPESLNTSAIPVEEYDFPMAVKVELEWLVEKGIIDISQDLIDTIYEKLGEQQNGGFQYWTQQGMALQYNRWFIYDKIHGSWGGESDGVNGVRGCLAIQLPGIEKFDNVSVREQKNRSAVMNDIVINVQGRTITVNGGNDFTADKISVISVSGRIMRVFKNTHTGKNRLTLNDIAPGAYVISCKYRGMTVNRSVFIQ